jgi:hypothetical protein
MTTEQNRIREALEKLPRYDHANDYPEPEGVFIRRDEALQALSTLSEGKNVARDFAEAQLRLSEQVHAAAPTEPEPKTTALRGIIRAILDQDIAIPVVEALKELSAIDGKGSVKTLGELVAVPTEPETAKEARNANEVKRYLEGLTVYPKAPAIPSGDVVQESRQAFYKLLDRTTTFCERLLNPEDLGYAVTEEVRDEARKLLGIPPVRKAATAPPEAETHCGHPLPAISSGSEGTTHCKACEAESREALTPTELETAKVIFPRQCRCGGAGCLRPIEAQEWEVDLPQAWRITCSLCDARTVKVYGREAAIAEWDEKFGKPQAPALPSGEVEGLAGFLKGLDIGSGKHPLVDYAAMILAYLNHQLTEKVRELEKAKQSLCAAQDWVARLHDDLAEQNRRIAELENALRWARSTMNSSTTVAQEIDGVLSSASPAGEPESQANTLLRKLHKALNSGTAHVCKPDREGFCRRGFVGPNNECLDAELQAYVSALPSGAEPQKGGAE